MIKIESYGQIKEGKLHIIKRDSFTDAIKTLPKGRYKIIIEKLYRKRSNPQNAYLWGVVYKELIIAFQNAGWREIKTDSQVHDFCKDRFLKIDTYNDISGDKWQIIRSTTELTTTEFNEYIEDIRYFASEFLGHSIPEPNELMEELKL